MTANFKPQQKSWLLASALLALLLVIGAIGIFIRSGGQNAPANGLRGDPPPPGPDHEALLRSIITATYTPDCTLGVAWRIVASPNQILQEEGQTAMGGEGEAGHNNFSEVAALSANDAWAVGTVHEEGRSQSVVAHWDGVTWRTLPRRNVAPTGSTLNAVAAISPNDVWVAGSYLDPKGGVVPLTEHWNGTNWTLSPNPDGLSKQSILHSISANSTNDVWAVGYTSTNEGKNEALIERWDGQKWRKSKEPPVEATYSQLHAVRALSAQDVWAVGEYIDASGAYKTLAERWDGTVWSVVPSPSVGTLFNHLVSVASVSPKDVWAVGYSANATGGYRTLIEHWDGAAWSVVPSPSQGDLESKLNSISALSPNDVWAVGHYLDQRGYKSLIEHWDGKSWTIIPNSNAGAALDMLLGVWALNPTDVWAVGYHDIPNKISVTLIQRFNDPCNKR